MATSTKPAKGMRDLLPRQMLRRERVVETIKRIYRSYGFEPLETPACERLEVLLGKYGEEGDQLVFKILQRGEQFAKAVAAGRTTENELADMALRYDLTVPLARVVAEYQNDLPKYFKRYQIQPVWRADRPQKGRFREFYQCDVDVVGSPSLAVEVEVASAVSEVLETLGFADFTVRLNHRRVLFGLIEAAGVPAELEGEALTAIDKLDKIGPDGVRAELASRGVAPESVERLVGMLGLGASSDVLGAVEAAVGASESGRAGVAELRTLVAYAEGTPFGRHLRVDPFLARGLSYYTGPIFEIAVSDLAGSLGGGGRYDNLIGMFLGRTIPACGFSLGLERILVVMEERGMFGDVETAADVMVAVWDEASTRDAIALAAELRAAGLRVDLFPDRDKVGKQMKYADSRGYPYVAIVGPDERERGTVAVKDLKTGEQTEVPRPDVAEWLVVSRSASMEETVGPASGTRASFGNSVVLFDLIWLSWSFDRVREELTLTASTDVGAFGRSPVVLTKSSPSVVFDGNTRQGRALAEVNADFRARTLSVTASLSSEEIAIARVFAI